LGERGYHVIKAAGPAGAYLGKRVERHIVPAATYGVGTQKGQWYWTDIIVYNRASSVTYIGDP